MSIKVAKKAKMITYSSYPIGWNKLKDLGWLKYKYIYIYIYKIFKKKWKKNLVHANTNHVLKVRGHYLIMSIIRF